MEPRVAASIPLHEEVKRLWVYLEKRYCVANGPRLHQLRAAIVSCTQQQQMSIEEYYTRLMALYDELNRLRPLPLCGCSQCLCDVNGKLAAAREEEILHQFSLVRITIYIVPFAQISFLIHPRQLCIRVIKRLFKKSIVEILLVAKS